MFPWHGDKLHHYSVFSTLEWSYPKLLSFSISCSINHQLQYVLYWIFLKSLPPTVHSATALNQHTFSHGLLNKIFTASLCPCLACPWLTYVQSAPPSSIFLMEIWVSHLPGYNTPGVSMHLGWNPNALIHFQNPSWSGPLLRVWLHLWPLFL